MKLAGLSDSLSPLIVTLVSWTFKVNLDATCYLKVLLLLLVMYESHSDLYNAEMKF